MKVSIITPCLNEELNIEECYLQVKNLFNKLNLQYEHIFIDNKSSDKTRMILKDLAYKDENIKLIFHSRNFDPFKGQFNALKYTKGDAIVLSLSADLQDPVEVIEDFIKHWLSKDGYMVVAGCRHKRDNSFIKNILTNLHYKMFSSLSDSDLPNNIGEFTLIDKSIRDVLLKIDDHYPYIRGLINYLNFKTKIIYFDQKKRKIGKSKYSILDNITQSLNAFVSFSTKPIRIFLLIGFIISFVSILYGVYLFFASIFSDNYNIQPGIKTLLVALFIFFGLNFVILGILGEFIISINNKVRKKPLVVEEEKINL